MFVPLIVVNIAIAAVTLNIRDTADPKGYATEAACNDRVAEIVQAIGMLQSNLSTIDMRIVRATCERK
jgi:hypothetical protein